jgi:fermentation-respiration switch protein FrsA (DUF1100 family)
MRRLLLGSVLTIAAAYGLVTAGLWHWQDRLLYFPDPSRPDPVAAGLGDMTIVTLRTGDGLALNAWFKPPQAGQPTIILLHGNGGNMGLIGTKPRPWIDAGLGVLMFDWRGYGGNPGKPREAGLLLDGEAALAFAASRGAPAERVVLWGESLGSGIAVQLAARHKVGALVLESPYTSVAAVAAARFPYFPVTLLIADQFDSLAVVGRVTAPVLLVHGEADEVIPVRFGRLLFEAIRAPKQALFVPQGLHHNLGQFGLSGVALDFLRRHLAG